MLGFVVLGTLTLVCVDVYLRFVLSVWVWWYCGFLGGGGLLRLWFGWLVCGGIC